MIGPVQLLMIGFKGSRTPDEVRKRLEDLHTGHHIRVIDMLALVMHRNRTLERIQAPDLLATSQREAGALLDSLLREAGAAAVRGDSISGGRGYLFSGDDIPHLRREMRPGTGAVILLLEHRWAIPLRDAIVHSDAFPIADAWVGRAALQTLSLAAPIH
ncbi:hypothetical protein [Micromonospora sp. DPT]|uniref:hypothetical protein n=1 Tax=Micromonospora sp. DPT TaxID=3142975 RepID=UPI0032086E38